MMSLNRTKNHLVVLKLLLVLLWIAFFEIPTAVYGYIIPMGPRGQQQQQQRRRLLQRRPLRMQQTNENDRQQGVINYKMVPEGRISRRCTLSAFAASGFATPFLLSWTIFSPTTVSHAAPPVTVKEAEGLVSRIERKIRKPPTKLLRPILNLDFAVLLMRSSYNAVDELNFVPMDQFQKDFFLIRQAEYLPYADALGPGLVKQGELTDAFYFDFISFAQYSTIYRDISVDPLTIFEEKQPVDVGEGDDTKQEFVTTVIQRDPTIENFMLPRLHDELVGSKILDKLIETFGDTPSAIPILNEQNCSSRQVLKALQQLVNLFLVNGFAFDGKVEMKKDGVGGGVHGSEYIMTLTAPANLWSGQSLQLKNAFPTNDFVQKTAKVLLKRAGLEVASCSIKYTNSEEVTSIVMK